MKSIITTVGTSVFENYIEHKNLINDHYAVIRDKQEGEWRNCEDRIKRIKDIIIPWSKDNPDASAEIKSIIKIQGMLKEDIRVFLLATDTIVSRLAAEIIQHWFEDYDKKIEIAFNVETDVIKSLQVAFYKSLIKEGLPNLINRINLIAGGGMDSKGYFKDIIFNITGGYKAIIPFMTIMAQVKGCKTVYIFEDTDSLILIPNLPLKIDFGIFEDYPNEIALLDEGMDNYHQEKDRSFQAFSELEEKCMIEQIDNHAFLSPVGRIFHEEFKDKYLMFYAPDDIYSELNGQADIKRILKTKFKDKKLVEAKTEIKGGHYVYDDGNNDNRIYYLRDKGLLFIYKTFQSEEDARQFIAVPVNKDRIIQESKPRRLEV